MKANQAFLFVDARNTGRLEEECSGGHELRRCWHTWKAPRGRETPPVVGALQPRGALSPFPSLSPYPTLHAQRWRELRE